MQGSAASEVGEESKRNSGLGRLWLAVLHLLDWSLTYRLWISGYGTGLLQPTPEASVFGASLE